MQSWQIKALALEMSALDHLDGFIRDHALYCFIGVIWLLMVLLAWVLAGGLRRKSAPGKSRPAVRPAIFIHLPGPPPRESDDFNPFPPPHHSAHCNHDDDDWE
jgi:hypothetical protein